MKILGPSTDTLDAIPLSEVSTTPRYVDHGAVASVARPAGSRPVIWRGSVEPTNMVNGDEWEREGTSTVTNGAGVATITKMTQAAYDALGTKDANTMYVIVG